MGGGHKRERIVSIYIFLQHLSQSWIMKNYFYWVISLFIDAFLYGPCISDFSHAESYWILLYTHTHVRTHTYTHPSIIVQRLEKWIWHLGNVQGFQRSYWEVIFVQSFLIGHLKPVILICKVNVFIHFPLALISICNALLRWTSLLKGRA